MRLSIDSLQYWQVYFQVFVPVPIACCCCCLLRGADCSACADDRSGPRVADPASISTISEPRKTTKRCQLKSEGLAQTTTRWSSDWTCKPTLQSKDVRRLGPSLATWPYAACQMDQFQVFRESVPRQILLLALLVIPGAATGTQVLQFDKKIRSVPHFLRPPAIDKEPESNAKMYVKQRRDEMVRTWKHILRHEHLARNTGAWAFFFRTPFSTTFRWRIFSQSISGYPKSPFPSKTQNRQIARTSPLTTSTSVQCSDGSIGKPGKGLRFCSACAGAQRSTLTPCDQLFTCVLPAYVAHAVCLSTCVCHALRQFGDVKSPHTPLVVLMVDAQFFENCTTDRASGQLHGPREHQAAEEVLVRSLDHPARGRAPKRLTSCPQLTSHDRTLDDASSSSGRQTEKRCSEAAIARPPVCRTLEQSEIRDSNFRVLAPGCESKRSRIFDLQKVYNGKRNPNNLLHKKTEEAR